ncbi:MAG: glycosyltransferase family 8 protein [Selenomonadaceae bacterium]|nr:glycosyltransferase family 8 protein [Selenomonadaceae bacterium]
MIHVCFSLYDKLGTYSKFTGTAMLSLFDNTTADVTVHILHDNTLTPENRNKFIYLAGRYGQAVKFYNVEELCAEKLDEYRKLLFNVDAGYLTVGALYRLFVPQILPNTIDKIIYLDSDIIVNLDIKELWQIALGDKILAAVHEILSRGSALRVNQTIPLCKYGFVKGEDYFNSGVLVMNLNLLRNEEETLLNGVKFIHQHPQCGNFLDQDVLNYCFANRTLRLPIKFNRFFLLARIEEEKTPTKKIYHYAGKNFTCSVSLDMNDAFNRLWMNYFIKTPWFSMDSIGRLYEDLHQSQILEIGDALRLSSIVSGKTRAFVLLEKDLDTLIEKFSVRADEEVFAIKSTLPLQKLINMMNVSRGKKIFFILLPGFEFDRLTAAGFVRDEDFVNGFDFLLKEYDSYLLIHAM